MDRSMVGETMFIYGDPSRSWGGSAISAGPGAAAAAALGQGDAHRGRAQGPPPVQNQHRGPGALGSGKTGKRQ